MSPTVHDLRNEIRASVDRFEREVSAQFTKEELAAIVDALDAAAGDQRPSKTAMRADIRRATRLDDGEEVDGSSFTKADLEAIVGALEG